MFGTRSEQGEPAVERLLTIVRTCQLQQLLGATAAIAARRSESLSISCPIVLLNGENSRVRVESVLRNSCAAER
jgi:hypothetical protein